MDVHRNGIQVYIKLLEQGIHVRRNGFGKLAVSPKSALENPETVTYLQNHREFLEMFIHSCESIYDPFKFEDFRKMFIDDQRMVAACPESLNLACLRCRTLFENAYKNRDYTTAVCAYEAWEYQLRTYWEHAYPSVDTGAALALMKALGDIAQTLTERKEYQEGFFNWTELEPQKRRATKKKSSR